MEEWVDGETVLTMRQARDEFRVGDYEVGRTTLHRWATKGYKGVVLESVQVGKKRLTTREALGRFRARMERARAGMLPGFE